MKTTKFWNAFIKYTISALLLIFPALDAQLCIWEGDSEDTRFWLFQPNLLGASDLMPFNYSAFLLYSPSNDTENKRYESDLYQPQLDTTFYNTNVREWAAVAGATAKADDIRQILYHTPPDVFRKDLARLEAKNSFLQSLKNLGDNSEAYNYLKFSKRCESELSTQTDWSYQAEPDSNKNTRQRVIVEGEKLLSTAKKSFVRLRAAYQVMKLYHYQQDTQKVIQLYENNIQRFTYKSWIRGSADFYYAVAMPSSEWRNYWLMQAFGKSEDKRGRSIQFFERDNEDIYKKSLSLAKNPHEKALMLTMTSLKTPGRELRRMKEIYGLNATLPELAMLMQREINKVEDWLYSVEVMKNYAPSLRKGDEAEEAENPNESYEARQKRINERNLKSDYLYLQEIELFTKQVLADAKQTNRAFWTVAAAHLALLQKKFGEAKNLASQVKTMQNVPLNISVQARLTALLADFMAQPTEGGAWETQVIDFYNFLEKEKNNLTDVPSFRVRVANFIAAKLEGVGQRLRAHLLFEKFSMSYGNYTSSFYTKLFNQTTPAEYDALIYLLQNPKTPFERFLVEKGLPSQSVYEPVTMPNGEVEYKNKTPRVWDINKLRDYKATYYIRQDKLDSALAVFRTIPNEYWKKEPYSSMLNCNPFFVDWRDTHTPNRADSVRFTKKTFVERLIQLKQELEKDPIKYEKNYYLIGNAYYNMTKNGNYWLMWEIAWSNYDNPFKRQPEYDIYFGCTLARKYYELGARKMKDEKLRSLCYFMTEKCHVNWQEYLNDTNRDGQGNRPTTQATTFATEYLRLFPNHKKYTDMKYWCQEYENIAYSFVGMCK